MKNILKASILTIIATGFLASEAAAQYYNPNLNTQNYAPQPGFGLSLGAQNGGFNPNVGLGFGPVGTNVGAGLGVNGIGAGANTGIGPLGFLSLIHISEPTRPY